MYVFDRPGPVNPKQNANFVFLVTSKYSYTSKNAKCLWAMSRRDARIPNRDQHSDILLPSLQTQLCLDFDIITTENVKISWPIPQRSDQKTSYWLGQPLTGLLKVLQ